MFQFTFKKHELKLFFSFLFFYIYMVEQFEPFIQVLISHNKFE